MSNKTKPFDERSYTIFAVDFDGVLCRNAWPKIGEPLENNIAWIREMRALGNKVILWTNRERLRLDQAVEWCREHGLEFDAVNANLPEVIAYYGCDSRKITADYYIDDKAILLGEWSNWNDDPIKEAFRILSPSWTKTIDERIADGEIDPAYFFEGGKP